MTDRMIYVLPAPESTQQNPRSRSSREQSVQALLDGNLGSVESTGITPSDQRLEGQYRHALAEKMATELKELANAGGIEAIPYFGIDESTPEDGYYTLSDATVERIDGRVGEFQRFDASFTEVGTRASHRKEVSTDVSQADHPFGNSEEALVGIPSVAQKVQWYDPETGDREEATVAETRTGEHRDVDLYDALESSFYDGDNEQYPSIIYDLELSESGWCDPRVWDTRGEPDRVNDSDEVVWAKAFVPSHQFVGDAILENELVKLTFDLDAQALTVEEWDDSAGAWSGVDLGDSEWSFYDLDIREISLSTVTAIVEFHNASVDPTEYYPLRMHLKRGWDWPLWEEIKGEGGTPPGLVDLLDPIASASNYDPGESQTLRKRSDL